MKFRLGRVTHHQTVMPLILQHLPWSEVANLLHNASKGSRAYLNKDYALLSSEKDDLREVFRERNGKKKPHVRTFDFSKSEQMFKFAEYTETGEIIQGGNCQKLHVLSSDLKQII